MTQEQHWERIYRAKPPTGVSWYQARPSESLRLIEATHIEKDRHIIDVGGGASTLVDCLLAAGFCRLALLDISAAAIRHAQARLGAQAQQIDWYQTDVTRFRPPRRFDLWHDRAVFHCLTDAVDRRSYLRVLHETVRPGGHLIIATFALAGPKRCSGLDVVRYDAPSICAQLGGEFELLEQHAETHSTPANVEQEFATFRFTRRAA